ncbi:MAG: AAA family ATPase [Candidatus Sumerlaeia bacterium]|nr:AAA family ATPase [Candidatus Sumerlaeia bacterium]
MSITPTTVIGRIAIEGFKSIGAETSIQLCPLTILAGANSSGKSSFMQPLLLLKQTLDAATDPGPLKLDGPHVRFTSFDQLLSKSVKGDNRRLKITVGWTKEMITSHSFSQPAGKGQLITLEEMGFKDKKQDVVIREGASVSSLKVSLSSTALRDFSQNGKFTRTRFYYSLALQGSQGLSLFGPWPPNFGWSALQVLKGIVHVPGLRGQPSRTYRRTGVPRSFDGPFDDFVASVVHQWQAANTDDNKNKLAQLNEDLSALGLTWKVRAVPVNDVEIEIKVGRLGKSGRGGSHDLVSIADVGFGVSQCLPVVASLIAAPAKSLVYIEQPELHLHPRAQRLLAPLVLRAVLRGVQVVLETHSSLLLNEFCTLVAQGKLDRKYLALHWASRDDVGQTCVRTAEIQPDGSYGDWPQDFDDVALSAEVDYLKAAQSAGG